MSEKSETTSSRSGEPPSWSDLGEGFEALGRVGLAMAVGFSAAGAFCRLVDKKAIRLPSLSSLLLAGGEDRTTRSALERPAASKTEAARAKKAEIQNRFRRFEVGDLDEAQSLEP